MTAPVMDLRQTERRALLLRLRRFWNRPWSEKVFVFCTRMRMSFPGFPCRCAYPSAQWWLIRRAVLDFYAGI
jgi:hypothetical protein